MKCKEKLEEEVGFWIAYISRWQATNNDPIPDRAQQLLNNALLQLENHSPGNDQALLFQGGKN